MDGGNADIAGANICQGKFVTDGYPFEQPYRQTQKRAAFATLFLSAL